MRRRRWRAPVAVARSARDAFGHAAAPDVYTLDRAPATRVADRAPFAIGMPDVFHVRLPGAPPPVRHRAMRGRRARGSSATLLVELLRARGVEEAREIEAELFASCPPAERASAERAASIALGREPLPGRWGEDAVADWLRVRLLDTADGPSEPTRWLGVLAWLGGHAEHAPDTLEALPLAAAALVVTKGPGRALTTVIARGYPVRRTHGGADVVRSLVLRCALEGEFLPEALRRVVPSPRRGGDVVAEAWKPLLLARRALEERGHVVGVAHLTAALVATDLRRRILGDLRLIGRHVRLPSWGSRSLDEEEAANVHEALQRRTLPFLALRDLRPAPPWPREWGGPDARAIADAAQALIGGDARTTHETFVHDGLALAAVHALGGHATNALAALGASRTPPALEEVRSRLARAIHSGIGTSTLPKDLPTGPEVEAVHRQLRRLPEPSLALETPYSLLGAQRAEAQHALQTSGRLRQFRDLRLVLDRPDVARALAPFWLVRDTPGLEDGLIGLVRATGAVVPPPTADECLRFLRSLE